jgi:flagellar motility protein MotE (MotC chaperone)
VELHYVQTCQKKRYFHETEHDEQYKDDLTSNQDIDNLNESCYNLEKHKEKSKNLTYDHCMDEVVESRDTQKYKGKHSQESILKDIQKVFYD